MLLLAATGCLRRQARCACVSILPLVFSRPQVACGSGLVRIYNFLRSDEPSQYPKVGFPPAAARRTRGRRGHHFCVMLAASLL